MENKKALWRESSFLSARIDSQDTWIWRGTVPQDVIKRSMFYQGLPRCDQRIAAIFRVDGEYTVSNPSLAIRTLHIERALRAWGSGEEEPAEKPTYSYDSKKNVHGDFENVLIDARKLAAL